MEFRFGGFNKLYRTPSASSSSIYTNFSHHAPEDGLLTGRSVGGGGGRSEIFRDFEKKIIREEILAEEAERRRVLEAEVRMELMMEREMMAMHSRLRYSSSFILDPPHSHHTRFHPAVLHGESRGFAVEVEVEVVPFQRRPQSPEITYITTSLPKVSENGTIGLGKPNGLTLSGAKRKPPPAAGSSAELCYSRKEEGNEWSCALCEFSATSERGLQGHLAGKKHQAKAAGLRAGHTGKTKNCVIKSSSKSCKVGASDEKVATKRKKHLKNLKRPQKSRGKAC